MKILVLGGTRFVGKALVTRLIENRHELILFTRGHNKIPENVTHIKGDRKSDSDLQQLNGIYFDVIVDSSGRNMIDTQKVLNYTGIPKHRFIYISSAGVYSDSDNLPINEDSDIDKSSRHYGKFETESFLINNNIPFTSFRPTYIYGPGNYNPIEKWFFDRITNNRPIPIPGNGEIITQLGHVSDLAEAISISIDREIAINKIYNCSGKFGITLRGLVHLFASICGKDSSEYSIKYFDSNLLQSKARKSFPLRISHFLTDISKIEKELEWQPKYDLRSGLKDSYINDYLINKNYDIDFSSDSIFY